jgi:hypothetical protein
MDLTTTHSYACFKPYLNVYWTAEESNGVQYVTNIGELQGESSIDLSIGKEPKQQQNDQFYFLFFGLSPQQKK